MSHAPSPASVTLQVRLRSYVEPMDWRGIFEQVQPVELELGAGDGSFLAQYAARHPEHNFLGVERLLGRLHKLGRKGQRGGLKNLRVLRLEAAYALQYLVPPASLRALHVYFPDPWPKRRHWKNRLIHADFVKHAARALEAGGRLHLRTDDAAYFDWMQEALATEPRFQSMETTDELLAVKTDFEREFNARGIETKRLSYELKPA